MAITSAGQVQMEMVNPQGYSGDYQGTSTTGDNTDYGTETLSAHVAVTRPS